MLPFADDRVVRKRRDPKLSAEHRSLKILHDQNSILPACSLPLSTKVMYKKLIATEHELYLIRVWSICY